MSLLIGARELAYRSGQECTVWHVFWAALPPYTYPPYSYPDDATRRALETVPYQTRESWAQALQLMIAKAAPGQGQSSRDLADALAVAQDRADRSRRQLTDCILLATIIDRESTIQSMILASREDYRGLIQKLDDQSLPLGNPTNPPVFAMTPAQSPEDKERELASRALNDFLKIVAPSEDLRYANLQTIETDAFLATLAQASTNSVTLVCGSRRHLDQRGRPYHRGSPRLQVIP